jgi:RNA polymerase sigma-70 factor (ECF subfamily)
MELYGPSMVRTAWRVLGRYGGSEADDVVQEAFVAALTTPALPTIGGVGGWLRSITVRKALDSLRRSARRGEQPILEAADSELGLSQSDSAERRLEIIRLRRALSELSPLDRAVLVLADVEGRSMAEVAEVMGSTRVAVKLRASRARRRLARTLRGADTTGLRVTAAEREGK